MTVTAPAGPAGRARCSGPRAGWPAGSRPGPGWQPTPRPASRRRRPPGWRTSPGWRSAPRRRRPARRRRKAGTGRRPDGRVPVAPDDSAHVRRDREAAAKAEQALAGAVAAPAVAAEPDRPPKANTTDPGSRVMPGKQGGFCQAYNPQVVACGSQVILSVGTHDSPVDVQGLHPAMASARENLDAAGITAPIGSALWDAGYASEANFTGPCEAELYIAVTREARQTGRLQDGGQRERAQPGWQAMTAKLDTPEGRALYKRRSAIIEPVFAQLFARLGRDLHYRGTMVGLELHLWAATHNFLKAIRARARTAAPAAAA